MEQKLLKIALLQLRILGITLLLLLPATLISFKADRLYLDIWKQLGMTESDGSMNVQESFLNGYLQHAGARNLKSIALNDREAIAKDLLAYTKAKIHSTEFRDAYEKERKRRKPSEPAKARTEEEIRGKGIADFRQGLENLEKGMKTATPENKKLMQGSVDMLQQQIKDYQDPNNALIKMVVQNELNQYEARMTEYRAAVKKWEEKYPEAVSGFVKRRLVQVLESTKDIDYSAQLTERNGRKYFARPDYEKKNSYWKMGFRASREVTETVRAFAQQWLKELN